ncbi:MAG TPA: hypothetical protein VEV87_09020, partial [Chitinophagaceae bacterium]|nr:hypothetical protein [Chitinophagaceae bacterium]
MIISKALVKKTEDNIVSVVHLIWLHLGTGLFNNFISTYCKYNSGYPHELVLLFNGVSETEEIFEYIRIVEGKKIPYRTLVHYGNCQDLDAYFWAADQLKSTWLLFLNSYSEILAEDWLVKYLSPTSSREVGMVGATGSWQSYYRTVFINNKWKWERKQTFKENIRKFKLMIKALLYWRFLFPDFPNPHIRTNAFMIRRALMVSMKRRRLKNKLDAYAIESGYNNLTAQVFRKGMEAVVICKSGKSFKKSEWAGSKVFWNENQ